MGGQGSPEYRQYIAEDGLLNEFKLMWELRESFPLHFAVFKQLACHLSHEANVEQVFSRAGLVADPNLLPSHLSTLVMVSFNRLRTLSYYSTKLNYRTQKYHL